MMHIPLLLMFAALPAAEIVDVPNDPQYAFLWIMAILAMAPSLMVFWIGQISSVITRADESYKVCHDKWMWFIVTVLLGPMDACAYWISKPVDLTK